eukprot:Nk52_evm17s288 gene=Nk52_evmTU17s288
MVEKEASKPVKRKAGECAITAEEKAKKAAQEEEKSRLLDKAFDNEMFVSKFGKQEKEPVALVPGRNLLGCEGKDIIRKGNARKSKYLFAFPGTIRLVSSGEIGAISELNTPNPVLYVNFPEGRMKMRGALVYTASKYLTFHCNAKKGVTCEDTFDQLVVFSEFYWIGKEQDNPSEEPLPFPKSLCKIEEEKDSEEESNIDDDKDTTTILSSDED